ncbi:hypothetical protein IAU60_003912 [Kwoniella sp. DSM 27419]
MRGLTNIRALRYTGIGGAASRPVTPRPLVGCSHWIYPDFGRRHASKGVNSGEHELEEDDLFGDGPSRIAMSTAPDVEDDLLPHADVSPTEDGAEPPRLTKYEVLDRPKLPGSIKRLNRILSRQRKMEIPESDLDEKFVKGRGPGGQAINKTNSSVSLTHIPTGIRVQAQPTRSREENRKVARRILAERLEVLKSTGQLPGHEIVPDIGVQIDSPLKAPDTKGKGKKAVQKEEEKVMSSAYTRAEIRAEKERRRKANRAKKAKKKYGQKGAVEEEVVDSAEAEEGVSDGVRDSTGTAGAKEAIPGPAKSTAAQ